MIEPEILITADILQKVPSHSFMSTDGEFCCGCDNEDEWLGVLSPVAERPGGASQGCL